MAKIIRLDDMKREPDDRRAVLKAALNGVKFELFICSGEMGEDMRTGKIGDHIKDAMDHLNQALELLEEQ